ncbi:MAG: ABC transporter permease subunit, partial [Acidimicrobiales bacterium]
MEIFAASLVGEEAPRFVLLGMATGSLTALVALGIVLVYRTSGVLNFSAGALGGIAAFFFYDIRDDGYPTWWALTFSLAVGVLLGLLTYAVLAWLSNASQLSKLIAT